jgi:hypothetical protein
MEPFAGFPAEIGRAIRFVLTDIDDTLTSGGRVAAATYQALERLHTSGFRVIPISAAPAGWCDAICRMWPVDAVIGENGGFYFDFDAATQIVRRRFWTPNSDRKESMARLAELGLRIVAAVPGSQIAHDQRYREATLAITYETRQTIEPVIRLLKEAGAKSTVNSMWVLGWFGEFDKLSTTRQALAEFFSVDISENRQAFVYVGDSLNDEPMFAHFPNSVGVATVKNFANQMVALPRWITAGGGGIGFVEVAEALVAARP